MPEPQLNPYEPPRSQSPSRGWLIVKETARGAWQGLAGTGIVVAIIGTGAFFASFSEERSPQGPGIWAFVMGGLVVLAVGSLVGSVMRLMEVTGMKKVTDDVLPTILPAEAPWVSTKDLNE